MTLARKALGITGMAITRVGFGAWAVGGGGWQFGWGAQDESESVASIRHAIASGVNWIDTAPVYGMGQSEEIVGRALRDVPEDDRPLVFTKCGLDFDRAHPAQGPRNVMDAKSVRRELHESLERLKLERVDLYQVHWPPQDGTPLEDYWATMLELKREGLVRAIGLSNHDEDQLRRAEQIGHVDALQPPFSMIHRDAAGLIARAARQRTGVIVYSPMQSGLLTGAMSAERIAALPDDDWRREHEDFQGENLKRNLALAHELAPVAQAVGVPTAALAVAWALSWPGVTGAIVGARRPDQIAGWLDAGRLQLSDEVLAQLAQAISRSGAGEGPLVAGAASDGAGVMPAPR
jgi:aryl-alcohol dehydrogenase-like predicted oxidoreductase